MRKSSINSRRLAGGLLGSLLLGAAALGFDHITDQDSNIYVVVWNPGTIAMQLKIPAGPQPLSDSSTYNGSVLTAMQAWNAQLGVVQFSGQINASTAYDTGNRINEIVMDSTVDGVPFPSGGTLAITQSFSDGGNTRTESDIVFNTNNIVWDSYRGPRRTGPNAAVDIQRVALHELGHVLGMDHPDEAGQPGVDAIMNSRVSDADALRPDDITGVQVLYGAPGVTIASQPNNNFANAITITAIGSPTQNVVPTTGSNIAATKEPGEPRHAPDEDGGKSVWWKWTANGSGSVTVTTLGSNFDTLLGVYTGITVGALTTIGSNDDVQSGVIRTSTVTFNATNGVTYFFAVDGWEGAFGAITLNVNGTLTGGNQPPVITTHPASVSVTTGGSATFTVVATGTGTLTYQWSFGSTPINGATNPSLTVNSVSSANAGFYSVVVTNAGGSTTSNTATLTVTAPAPPPPAPPSGGGGGGGGGAPSLWFYAVLSLLGLGRFLRRRA